MCHLTLHIQGHELQFFLLGLETFVAKLGFTTFLIPLRVVLLLVQ
jgi:hypothetical protein